MTAHSSLNIDTGKSTEGNPPEAPSGIGEVMTHVPAKYGSQGAVRQGQLPAWFSTARACARCHGLGYIIIGEEYEDCPVCKGTGISGI